MAAKRKIAKRRTATKTRATRFKVEVQNESFRLEIAPLWNDPHDEFTFHLKGRREKGRQAYARLHVGCLALESREDAEDHWPDNVSVDSNEFRPNADKLIAWAAEEFKKRGYKW